jgi:thiol:disulfide interchange protein DsbD
MKSKEPLGRWMKWTTIMPLLALALLPAWTTGAAAQAGAAPPKAATLVKATAMPLTLAAGERAEVLVTLEIAAGWHVNANPPSPDYLIPTTVTLRRAPGLTPGRTTYPAGEPVKLAFDENPLSVYSGEVTLKVGLAAARTAANGAHTLAGSVRFQSCDDEVCLAPASVPFSLEVTVTGGSAAGAVPPPPPVTTEATPSDTAGAVAADTAAGSLQPDTTTAAGDGTTAGAQSDASRRLRGALEKGGLWWFLALFLGGLALNLTPCVFPMLGITVSVFGARRRERPVKVLAHAVAYVLGIAVTYSALGVVAALTGGLFGSALQNPLVNVGLGLLFIVLSLSMFGLYEMQPPAWVLQRLGGADAGSLLGIFLSGLAVGIIAAPCVGPFVVAVLALLAQRGDALFGFQTMFAMSLGLGLPYLFLALFSNLIQSLPRSGDWMLWVKKVFGVLLASIGLYYALIGLAPRLAQWILPVALVLGGLYLGFVDRHGSAKRGFRTFKRALGALAVLAAIPVVMMLRAEGIRFQPYDEAAMRAALAAGRPVMLEFSADWCVPCHELDRSTFTDRKVIARSRDFVIFKVDLTRYDSPGSKTLRTRYGVTGVPEILFFTSGGGEVREARVIGFIPPGPFLERLDAVLAGGRPAGE